MTINDLKIGNFVKRFDDVCIVNAIAPNFILVKSQDDEIFVKPIDDINPIPITKEILENNLFFQDNKYFTLGITKETRIVLRCIDEEQNKWYAGIITVFDEIAHAHIKYFHQLQNLLQLAGIEKELII